MNPTQAAERLVHPHIENTVITGVKENDRRFCIYTNNRFFSVEKPVGKTPNVGQSITLYLYGGCGIQGIDLDGEPLFFKSMADLEAEWQEA